MGDAPHPVTYESIAPLITERLIGGGSVSVTFTCPATGVRVPGQAVIDMDPGVVGVAAQRAKHTLLGSIRRSIVGLVSKKIGSGTDIGSTLARDAAGDVLNNTNLPGEGGSNGPSEDRIRAAALAAFRGVADRFAWDPTNDRWIAAASDLVTTSPFDQLVSATPITEHYDRVILGRVLASVVASDGTMEASERDFVAAVLPDGAPPVEQLSGPPPDDVELSEVSPGVREAVLALGWAVAAADDHVADVERKALDAVANGLGIVAERAAQIQAIAQAHVIDELVSRLAGAGWTVAQLRTEAEALAIGIGFDSDEAARVVIRHQKRLNLV